VYCPFAFIPLQRESSWRYGLSFLFHVSSEGPAFPWTPGLKFLYRNSRFRVLQAIVALINRQRAEALCRPTERSVGHGAAEEVHAMIRRVFAALSLLVSVAVCSALARAETPTFPPIGEERIGSAPSASRLPTLSPAHEEQMVCRVVVLTNAIRVEHGLAPLQLHPSLVRAARWMASDMAQHDYLRHTDRLGRGIDPRLPEFGYADYREIGENIAGGQLTPEEVVAAWMRSPGHRANLLNPTFREIGVAHFAGNHTHYAHYWVQDFGVRADSYPVVINNKAPETVDPTVHLFLHGAGWAQQMRFSNDRVHWSSWETFRSRCDWTLDPGYGDRTVYAEVRGEGIVRRSADTVRLLASRRGDLIADAVTIHATQ
jgi:uncharacterized protein YkwD